MNDEQLIQLYEARNETAISETQKKYEAGCSAIAQNILGNPEDAAEIINDVYLCIWNRIPPEKPDNFGAYIKKITRNMSLTRYRKNTSIKRGGGQVMEAVEELEEVLPVGQTTEEAFEERELSRLINGFLEEQPKNRRLLFIGRYFYVKSDQELADLFKISRDNVRMTLMRTRNALKLFLEREGYRI